MNYFNYFSEIEDTFIRLRGKALFLSPLDWALIETWKDRKIPQNVAIRAIEKVFAKHDQTLRKRAIKGLAYCSDEVEAQFAEWSEMQVGKGDDAAELSEDSMFSPQVLMAHLEDLENNLNELKTTFNIGLADSIERIVVRLQDVKTAFTDAEHLEEDLTSLEKILDQGLLENFGKERLEEFRKETQNELKVYKKTMEPDVYQRTFDLLLLKKIRTETGVPRLSLFYL